jgi:hypothetical protein
MAKWWMETKCKEDEEKTKMMVKRKKKREQRRVWVCRQGLIMS